MKATLVTSILLAALLAGSRIHAEDKPPAPTPDGIQIVPKSEVEWTHLNPKRGDLAPMAGTLWGDRNSKGATGFLLKPADGFESPPHTHNVSYRGVVIRGAIHNDDPNAANMWMPPGSFWTQPKGHTHITAAKGKDALAYVEIEQGPYLVLPTEQAFDSGERPLNVDSSNIVWLGKQDLKWIDLADTPDSATSPKIAFLWGKTEAGQLNGTFVKLPAGFKGTIKSHGTTFRAVVIQGQPGYHLPGEKEPKPLEPGSYFSAEGEAMHRISLNLGEDGILYVRTNGKFQVIPEN
jgi:hypothetical protein